MPNREVRRQRLVDWLPLSGITAAVATWVPNAPAVLYCAPQGHERIRPLRILMPEIVGRIVVEEFRNVILGLFHRIPVRIPASGPQSNRRYN